MDDLINHRLAVVVAEGEAIEGTLTTINNRILSNVYCVIKEEKDVFFSYSIDAVYKKAGKSIHEVHYWRAGTIVFYLP